MRWDTTTEPLSSRTTLRLGGAPPLFAKAESEGELLLLLASIPHDAPLLVLGGGSNLLVGDGGPAMPTIDLEIRRRRMVREEGDLVWVELGAGEPWDSFVAECVREGLCGVESLSGIPGRAGATPIQNVGAYGSEVSDTLAEVRVFDRAEASFCTFLPNECAFGYRTSRFKGSARFVVTSVVFRLRRSPIGPIRYAELGRTLGLPVGASAPLETLREAVLSQRRMKGMVLDPCDADTRSAGSFFTNPLLDAAAFERIRDQFGDELPSFPVGDGTVKVPAAWLIERAGYRRGHRKGSVGISTKHALALVAFEGATAASLLALAKEIRGAVHAFSGITLVPEPVMVGCAWD